MFSRRYRRSTQNDEDSKKISENQRDQREMISRRYRRLTQNVNNVGKRGLVKFRN